MSLFDTGFNAIWMCSGGLLRSVSAMYNEGRSMDESSMVQIPLQLFEHLDSAGANNPEQYQILMLTEAEERAANLKSRMSNLTVIT
jgi:hypothetical protein